ncbi:DUF4178 domain-containing protein [Taibaiella soli]|uniref:DUF4178 domain-containing protein n=1 Tax=Taibaiella soli TaxID=1649169 RepID=A0A2W2BN06_9BACT|nr:DUF4178 domain-containing protein [Taibaiella soli]PZF74846.1 DUF4178 domain-containing protein [Taibaiella soli]
MSELTQNNSAGWTPQHIYCPQCKKDISYYDVKGSICFECPECHTYFEYEQPHIEKLRHFDSNQVVSPSLPIGTIGTIHEKQYMVIGFMAKKEVGDPARWMEYVLFNKETGYAMLVEFNGHWMFSQKAGAKYQAKYLGTNNYVVNDGELVYKLYHSYKFSITYAEGEFDWNIIEDEALIAYEYISPPYMLVHENHPKRSDWYRNEYFTAQQVADAFGVTKGSLPSRKGIGAIQPSPFDELAGPLKKFTLIAVAAVIIIQILFAFCKPVQQVEKGTYYSVSDSASSWNGSGKAIMTGSIPITQRGAVEITLRADIDNDWVELSGTFYNEATGAQYEFTKALEYYHGYEDGESWSEGDKEGTVVISDIPAGNYRMNIYPYREGKKDTTVDVTVEQNTTLFSNLFTILGVVLVIPVIMWGRRKAFEKQRWGD